VQTTTGTVAAVFVALFVAHQVGDHWVQTEAQAATKGKPGVEGRIACLAHVATYTLTAFVALAVLYLTTGVTGPAWRLLLGLTVSAVTHYVADRRTPLRVFAGWAGHRDFYRLGAPREGRDDNPSLGPGAYAQSWHYAWLFVAALIIA
jgi:hypothetical protein